jgi:hypothetical protein
VPGVSGQACFCFCASVRLHDGVMNQTLHDLSGEKAACRPCTGCRDRVIREGTMSCCRRCIPASCRPTYCLQPMCLHACCHPHCKLRTLTGRYRCGQLLGDMQRPVPLDLHDVSTVYHAIKTHLHIGRAPDTRSPCRSPWCCSGGCDGGSRAGRQATRYQDAGESTRQRFVKPERLLPAKPSRKH